MKSEASNHIETVAYIVLRHEMDVPVRLVADVLLELDTRSVVHCTAPRLPLKAVLYTILFPRIKLPYPSLSEVHRVIKHRKIDEDPLANWSCHFMLHIYLLLTQAALPTLPPPFFSVLLFIFPLLVLLCLIYICMYLYRFSLSHSI